MDNITHTLAGLLLAESVVQLRRRPAGERPSTRFARTAAVSSALAANLPDADIGYTGWGADHLTYLLHHRGYTHTVLLGLLGALIVYLAALLIWRWRAGERPPPGDAGWLGGLLVLSVLSHLVLDWTNSYGIHPFWPFDDHWYYGDAVFIVEPWLWVVSIPTLVTASAGRLSRVLLSGLLLAVLALAWRLDLVSATAAAALTTGAVLSIAVTRFLPVSRRASCALLGWVAMTLLMAVSSSHARAVTLRDVRSREPATGILDVVISPLPANPVCLSVLVIDRAGDVYRVAMGRVSAVPSLTPAGECARNERSAEIFRPSSWPSNDTVQWDREWTASASELGTLARESCPAFAGLRFMRVPVWTTVGDTVLLGDARYGGGSGNSFSDMRVPRRSTRCPDAVPPWIPPRADLLDER